MQRPVRLLPIHLALFQAVDVAVASRVGVLPGPAITVSPGELDRAVEITTGYPTFSWGGVAQAVRLELVVLAVGDREEPRVVLRRELPGAGSTWTPSRAECLAPGAYAWSVRALDATGLALAGDKGWAATRRFAVPAAPSRADLAAALELLRRWPENGESDGGSPALPATAAPSVSSRAAEVSGTAAIRGENPATTGANFGVAGVSHALTGAGVVAINATAGPDLILDGVAQGEADTNLSQSGLDRPSSGAQSFTFQNSRGGGMRLDVGASEVSLGGHGHAGDDIVSGAVADARVAATLTRDTEVMTIVLAGGGAGSTRDADLLDGLHGQSSQRRVTGVCAADETLQGINSDGSVVCTTLIGPPVLTEVVDEAGAVGRYPALAIGTDGFPIIAHFDLAHDVVLVTTCNDPACAGGDESTSVVEDVANVVGIEIAIAIGSDGFPVLACDDSTVGSVIVAKCYDPACDGRDELITTVDNSQIDPLQYIDLAIGADGLPVLSCYKFHFGSLRVAKCQTRSCFAP